MTFTYRLTALTALIALVSTPAVAEQDQSITVVEIAKTHCAVEWGAFETLKPGAWSELVAVKTDADLDAASTEAFNTYAAALFALADYSASFVGLADEANQTPANIALARAKYDLATCLFPTDDERDRVVALSQGKPDALDADLHETLFEAFDQFECMRFDKASEAIFALELTEQSPTFDFQAITSATMKVC